MFGTNETWQLAQINNDDFDSQRIQIKQSTTKGKQRNRRENNNSIVFQCSNRERTHWLWRLRHTMCGDVIANGSFYQYVILRHLKRGNIFNRPRRDRLSNVDMTDFECSKPITNTSLRTQMEFGFIDENDVNEWVNWVPSDASRNRCERYIRIICMIWISGN